MVATLASHFITKCLCAGPVRRQRPETQEESTATDSSAIYVLIWLRRCVSDTLHGALFLCPRLKACLNRTAIITQYSGCRRSRSQRQPYMTGLMEMEPVDPPT